MYQLFFTTYVWISIWNKLFLFLQEIIITCPSLHIGLSKWQIPVCSEIKRPNNFRVNQKSVKKYVFCHLKLLITFTGDNKTRLFLSSRLLTILCHSSHFVNWIFFFKSSKCKCIQFIQKNPCFLKEFPMWTTTHCLHLWWILSFVLKINRFSGINSQS